MRILEGNFVELAALTYQLLIEEKAQEFLQSLPKKSRRLMAERCLALADDPRPGRGGCDRETLHLSGFNTCEQRQIKTHQIHQK
jgi:hypothetical protein